MSRHYRQEDMSPSDAVGVVDGDEISFPLPGEYDTEPWTLPIVCCDCGLAHDFEFRVREGRVVVTVVGNPELSKRRLHLKKAPGLNRGLMEAIDK